MSRAGDPVCSPKRSMAVSSASGAGWTRAAALGVVLLWSTCFVAIKGLTGAAPPLLVAALRGLVAAAVLLPLAAFEGRLMPPRSAWPWLIALGLANTTLGLAGMFLSVGLVGAALPAVLANSQALLVAPAAVWFFREPLRPPAVAGLIVGMGGIGLLVAASAGPSWGTTAGALLGLASALGLAAGNLLMKRLSRDVEALPAVAWQFLIGGLGLLVWSAAAGELAAVTLGPRVVVSLLYLGVIGSAVASWAWYRLLARDSLIALSGITLLTPVLGAVWAILLFDERIGGMGWAGLALTVAGAALVGAPRNRTSPRSDPASPPTRYRDR